MVESSREHGTLVSFLARLPSFAWITQYRAAWIRSDLVAALSVASLYIPLSFSFAALAHTSPSCGIWAFIIQPIVYALLGSCPRLVVGPEATGSMLVAGALADLSFVSSPAPLGPDQVAGLVTFMAGAILFLAGVLRLGFLGRVLNRPLMRGSISGLGFALIINQALPELGLLRLARNEGEQDGSALSKLWFILCHLPDAHVLSATFAIATLTAILGFRSIQRTCYRTCSWLKLIPDRLILILIAAGLTRLLHLDDHGLKTLQPSQSTPSIPPRFSLEFISLEYMERLWATAAISALLGFFESSLTAKSLSPDDAEYKAEPPRPNTELVALGLANVTGGCFSTLPAFGGFGRSQLNAQTGAVTPLSSILLAMISLICLPFVSSFIKFVPVATLGAMTTAVGIAMMEECVHDLCFFWRVRAWSELSLMAVVFLATIAHSMTLGILLGVLLTLIQLVQNSAKSHSYIIDAICTEPWPGSDDPAKTYATVVQMPQSFTFSNCEDLAEFLSRCERQWARLADGYAMPVHAASPRCFILDARAMVQCDACALQILGEALSKHANRGVQIIMCGLHPRERQTLSRSGILAKCGDELLFARDMDEAKQICTQDHIA